MKKKRIIFKVSSTALAFSIGFAALVPTLSYAQTKNINLQQNQLQKPSELDKVLKEENISESKLIEYGNYVKEQTSGPEVRWKAAAIKKALKFAINHIDTIPSKTIREALKKYGNKTISAIDTIEVYSWYGIATALTKAGIPDKYADLIADFIVQFIL
ncbi:hypothetical protein PDQ34_22845 [Bacillus cereus]|nr:hypothetical protein [Bacillus cereus]MDA2571899.1 hypothetical protein [Bacillus cereus]